MPQAYFSSKLLKNNDIGHRGLEIIHDTTDSKSSGSGWNHSGLSKSITTLWLFL